MKKKVPQKVISPTMKKRYPLKLISPTMKKRYPLKLISPTMKKKGLSTIVVTVLIIGLALVALGIVWVIVSGILESSQEDAAFGQSRINLKLSSVFVDSSSVSLKVSRLTGPGTMNGLNFVFSDGRNSEIVENVSSLNELEERTFFLTLTELRYTSLKTVSIAPTIILPSGKKRIGNILDTYTIREENYNSSFYDEFFEGGGSCTSIFDCLPDEQGSTECNLTTGNVSIQWTVRSCDSGRCVYTQESRLHEYCSYGCYVENATCKSPPECLWVGDCGVSGRLGFSFCDIISGDVYQNFIYYYCIGGSCSNQILKQRANDCFDWGCTCDEYCQNNLGDAECNPVLDCFDDSDCDSDSFITDSEYCNDTEVWVDWGDNYCSNNYCANNVSQVFVEDCSEREGNWSCIGFECIEYIECFRDSDCVCGKRCIGERCVVENFVNSGTVNSIWPFDMGEYFDSPSLPKNEEEGNYEKSWTRFISGSEGRCLRVREHVYPTPPGENAYLRFDVKSTLVTPGDNYQVWGTFYNCNCTPF